MIHLREEHTLGARLGKLIFMPADDNYRRTIWLGGNQLCRRVRAIFQLIDYSETVHSDTLGDVTTWGFSDQCPML